MMGCLTRFLGLRKRSKQGVKSTDVPKQTEEVGDSGDAATGYSRAADLARTSETMVLGFDWEDLLSASAEVLGQGNFWTSYKVNLENGTSLVYKSVKEFDVPEKEFRETVEVIDKMSHENLLPLTAYLYSGFRKLLVYEYMPMGSLYDLLHVTRRGGRSPLKWETRFGITVGAAKALAYLHSRDQCHGNIKSSNILLTSSFEVRVSDFGLTNFGGCGYCAPVVIYNNEVSQKADVYNFGILFLELLTGKDPTESYLKDEGMDLTRWMRSAVDDEWTSAVFDVELLRHVNVEILLQYLELAFTLTAKDPDIRPSMPQVICQIEKLSHVH